MRVRTLWMVRHARRGWVGDQQGACAWVRRADALEAAAEILGKSWDVLRAEGWRLVSWPLSVP